MPDIVYYIDPPASPVDSPELLPEERSILETINRKVAAAESLGQILDDMFIRTRPICPCDRISLAFVEENGLRIRSHITRADYEPVLLDTGYAEDLEGSSLEDVIESGRIRMIRDLPAYLAARPESRSSRLLVREGVRSSMTCPLRVEGRAVGVFFRSSRKPDAYQPHQARLHLEIAERLSQAVEKAWRIDQLTAANEAYFEMLGFVAHELKSPVASLTMDAQTLLGGYLGSLEEPQSKKIEGMVRKAEYLLSLVGDYLDLARLEGGRMPYEPRAGIDLSGEILDRVEEILRPQIEAEEIRWSRALEPPDLRIDADPDLLRIALVNLASNAIKYGRRGGEVRVSARLGPRGLRLAVWNEGPGFPPEQRSKLFRRFSRLTTPELKGRKGTGVGLYTVWRIAKLHGGRTGARSEPGQWAEFFVEIPQPAPRAG